MSKSSTRSRLSILVVLIAMIATTLVIAQQGKRVDEAALRNAGANAEEWLSHGMDLGEKRFSPLKQIDASNVSRLSLAWSYDVPGTAGNPPGGGGQETTLLAWNNMLFGMTNWSVTFALDARTGKELWKWDPEVNRPAVQSKICCGVVNRGVAIYEGKVFAPIIDGRLVALDAMTGKPIWEARVGYPQEQYTLTMAPRIAKGKVILGASGAEYPVRGYVDAYDADTGRRAWRFYTVPGDPSKGFENEAMKKAAATWGGEWWKMGGGATVWDALAYDPQADLIYFGTGNGGPWPEVLRGSQGKDNLYVCSIIALRPDTGEMKWYYQVVPGDNWDYDSTQTLTLADLTINGRLRRVIMQANKNAFFYVLDRITGEFISAEAFAPFNWATGIDPKTGRPMVRPEANYGLQPIIISPGPGGAHNWSPMAFSPQTGLVYIPTTFGSQITYSVNPVNFVFREGRANTGTGGMATPGRGAPPPAPAAPGAEPVHPGTEPVVTPAAPTLLPMLGPQGGRGGYLVAWDPVAQKERWRSQGGGSMGGGVMTTAGNLVFQVLPDGRLIAFSADKGEKLLEVQTPHRVGMGPPMTYMVGGRQYVTLMGGRGAGGFGRGGPAGPPPAGAPPPPPAAAPAPAAGGFGSPPQVLTYAVSGAN